MQIGVSPGFESSHHSTLGGFYLLCKHLTRTQHASAPHMSLHLGRLAVMMGEIPSRCGCAEGKREEDEGKIRPNCQSWARPLSPGLCTSRTGRAGVPCEPRGAVTSPAAVAVATQRKRTEAGSTQGRCRATRTQSPRRWGKRSWRGAARRAHVDAAELPLFPKPCSSRLRWSVQRKS